MNSKTGDGSIVERGLTTIIGKDRPVGAVRVSGHLRERLNMAKTFDVAARGPLKTRSGARRGARRRPPDADLALPAQTADLRAPRDRSDGRWRLGRVLDADRAAKLKVALG